MKRFVKILTILAFALLASSCSPEGKIVKASLPFIESYIQDHISHPETYTPVSTKYYGEGAVDIKKINFSLRDNVAMRDVYVIEHSYKHRSRDMEMLERTEYFCVSKELDILMGVLYTPEQVAEELK